jgi:hypothetical protein
VKHSGNILLINNSDKSSGNTLLLSSQSYRKIIKSPQYLNVLNHGTRKMKGVCCFCFYKHHTRFDMEIIISANEKIVSMTKKNNLSKDMTEQQFMEWLDEIIKVGMADEPEIQEISV